MTEKIILVAPYSVGDYENGNLADVLAYLNDKTTIGLDTETTGLDPISDKIVMLQIGDSERQFVIDTRHVDIEPLRKILESKDVEKVMVNGKFDYEFILTQYGIRLENIQDCFLIEKILLGGRKQSAGLEALSAKYVSFHYTRQLDLFREVLSKDIRSEFGHLADESEFSTTQILYGAYDVILPLQILQKQLTLIRENGQEFCTSLENEYSLVLGDIETNGFYLSPQKWEVVGNETAIKFDESLNLLNSWIHDNGYSHYEGINWNSHKQVSALFKEIGVPTQILDKVKTKDPDEPVFKDSIQRTHIEKFQNRFEIVDLYLTYKTYAKALNTYGSKFLKNIHPVTGRVHSKYNQILNTGRMSSTSPNLQNIKRGSEYRQCFVPQDKDYVLVTTDYSAQESRIMGDIARDRHLKEIFTGPDPDFHTATAIKVWGKSNPDLRFQAKKVNFGIPYGISAHKLSRDLNIPLGEAEHIVNRWFEEYPDLRLYFEKMKAFVRKNGYIIIDPVTNRRYYPSAYSEYVEYKKLIDEYKLKGYEIPRFFWSRYYSALGKIERESQNYPIQGTGASMTKYAAVLLRREISKRDWWSVVKIVNIVHDEIVVECHKDLAPTVANIVKECMENAGDIFCKHIPMLAEPSIKEFWTH